MGSAGPRVRVEQLKVHASHVGKDYVIGTVVSSHGAHFEDVSNMSKSQLAMVGIHPPMFIPRNPKGYGRTLVNLRSDGRISRITKGGAM